MKMWLILAKERDMGKEKASSSPPPAFGCEMKMFKQSAECRVQSADRELVLLIARRPVVDWEIWIGVCSGLGRHICDSA